MRPGTIKSTVTSLWGTDMSKLSDPPTMLTPDDIRRVGEAIQGAVLSESYDLALKLRRVAEDALSFGPVAKGLQAARTERGLDVKTVAKSLKTSQYAVHNIERGRTDETSLRVVEEYAALLELGPWFDQWRTMNPELASRLGQPATTHSLVDLLAGTLSRPMLQSLSPAGPAPVTSRTVTTSLPPAAKHVASIFRLKVTLVGSQPPIWRRILVRGDTNLDGLHQIIQVAMGWTNSHLYQFEHSDNLYTDPETLDDDFEEHRDARAVLLGELELKPRSSFHYMYDFGDGWNHRITVEQVLDAEPTGHYPLCIGGARSCPQEDCGGIGGYEDLLKVLNDPSDPEHESTREWCREGFDPENFEIGEVNVLLGRARFRKRRR